MFVAGSAVLAGEVADGLLWAGPALVVPYLSGRVGEGWEGALPAGPGGEPGQVLVGVFGVGDGFFGHETVEHLAQGDGCVVGADDGGGSFYDRRPGDPLFHGAVGSVGILVVTGVG